MMEITETLPRDQAMFCERALSVIQKRCPDLRRNGFRRQDMIGTDGAVPLTKTDKDSDEYYRSILFQFLHSARWLHGLKKSESIYRHSSNYDFKTHLENWLKQKDSSLFHVCNGVFIAAIIHQGFKIERFGLNVYFNIDMDDYLVKRESLLTSVVIPFLGKDSDKFDFV